MAVAVLGCTFLSGYQAEEPTFRATTRLVEISVVAVDRDGVPVKDLKKGELKVSEKGSDRQVAVLQYEGAPPPQPTPLPKNTFSNRLEFSAGPVRNLTAILVDTLNTPLGDQIRVRGQVLKFLREMPSDMRVGLYHLGKDIRVLHDFSQDPESLRRALAKTGPGQLERMETDLDALAEQYDALATSTGMSAAMMSLLKQSLQLEAMQNARIKEARILATLNALGGLGRHLAQMPGRKNLVWVGCRW